MNNEFTQDVISKALAIVLILLPVIIKYIDFTPKKRKEILSELLNNALSPIDQILRNNTFDQIDEQTIKRIKEIHENNFILIPQTIHLVFKKMENEFYEGGINKSTYTTYYNCIDLSFSKAKQKLGFPQNGLLLSFQGLPIQSKIVLSISSFALFIGCGYTIIIKNDFRLFILFAIIYTFINMLYVQFDKWHISKFKRIRKQNDNKKVKNNYKR